MKFCDSIFVVHVSTAQCGKHRFESCRLDSLNKALVPDPDRKQLSQRSMFPVVCAASVPHFGRAKIESRAKKNNRRAEGGRGPSSPLPLPLFLFHFCFLLLLPQFLRSQEARSRSYRSRSTRTLATQATFPAGITPS